MDNLFLEHTDFYIKDIPAFMLVEDKEGLDEGFLLFAYLLSEKEERLALVEVDCFTKPSQLTDEESAILENDSTLEKPVRCKVTVVDPLNSGYNKGELFELREEQLLEPYFKSLFTNISLFPQLIDTIEESEEDILTRVAEVLMNWDGFVVIDGCLAEILHGDIKLAAEDVEYIEYRSLKTGKVRLLDLTSDLTGKDQFLFLLNAIEFEDYLQTRHDVDLE